MKHKRTITIIAATLVGAGLAGCSTTGGMTASEESLALQPITPISKCIRVDRVGEWYVTGPKTMIVRTGPEYFRIDMREVCPRLGIGGGIQFRIDPSMLTTGRICGNMLDAVYAGEIPCPIQKVTPISEKKFRALEDSAA